MPTNKKHFELIILGCSGGPISGKTCSFLLKPSDMPNTKLLDDTCKTKNLLALDAGTGLTSIVDILNREGKEKLDYLKSSFLLELYPNTFNVSREGDVKDNENDNQVVKESIHHYIDTSNLDIKLPFYELGEIQSELTNYQITNKILNAIDGYFITHSHMDHISSLIINSPAFRSPKCIYGLHPTIDSIRKNLFNGSVWPDFVSMGIVNLTTMKPQISYDDICERYSIKAFEVSHGECSLENDSDSAGRYPSTAFLITDNKFDYNMLFFGDVESDHSSNCHYNSKIWETISPLIINDRLSSIVIECSTVDMPPPLYGHMSPTNLVYEMLALRKHCVDYANGNDRETYGANDEYYRMQDMQPLDGLNVIVIHVKETVDKVNPRYLILRQLKLANEQHNLKIHYSIALSGLSLIV